jgi:hypothetical protein
MAEFTSKVNSVRRGSNAERKYIPIQSVSPNISRRNGDKATIICLFGIAEIYEWSPSTPAARDGNVTRRRFRICSHW